ncbi:MAG: dihydroneopterin aldolase [Sulfuricurvum sp.]|uniref:dihydroneopterin aldolase n=1 Tax=Sulfuricurvum sp. TaxID=2025608 RepID=UPI0035664359
MTVLIENLTFETVIGILDFERLTPQNVQIDCTIVYDYKKNDFINYADVIELIRTTMDERRFELIETALQELAEALKKSFPQINELYLSIRKPDILPHCNVGVAERFVF